MIQEMQFDVMENRKWLYNKGFFQEKLQYARNFNFILCPADYGEA